MKAITFGSFRGGMDAVGSVLCLPCAKNLINKEPVEARHPDWKLISCPVCGQECYISPQHERTLQIYPQLTAACTECALSGRCRDGE